MSLLPLPDQTVSEKIKDEEWHKDHVKNYVGFTNNESYNNQRKEILKLFRAYQADLNEKERELTKPITCPGGIDLGQEYVVYPLIQSKIEQIVGEFMRRPLKRKAYAIDKKSQSQKLQKKVDMVSEKIMREMSESIKSSIGFKPQTEQSESKLPNNIEEFFESDYKMIAEQVGDGLMRLLLDVNKQKVKFRDLFTQYAICDRAHAVLGKKEGHTYIRGVHPLDADYDLDPYKVVQDNHEFFFENYYLTENEIYNSFKLSKKQKEDIKSYFSVFSSSGSGEENHSAESLSVSTKNDGWFQVSNKTFRIRCVIAKWKSRKRIASIKTSKSKTGKTFYKKIDESYKVRKKDVIDHIDKEIPRYCIMLGPDLCLEWGEMKERYSRVDAKWHCTLPVTSIVRDNTVGNSAIKSIAAKLYPLQMMASDILFELRLAYKSSGDSRALVYDVAQMPKDFASTGGINRVISHLKKDKLLLINSKDKGQSKNTFNQFTSLDLSQKGVVNDLIAALGFIDDLASKFAGITPEREGQIGQYQTATGTDKAIRGSTARTEVIYTPFDDFIQVVLEKSIMKMQHDYEESQVIQYIFGDMKTKFMTVFKEFFSADLGVYLSNGRKDLEISERIEAAAELAIQTNNTPEMIMGLIEVFEGESASEKKAVFSRIINNMEKVRGENIKAQEAAQKEESQLQAKKLENENQLKREGFENNLDVANIYKDGKSGDNLQNNATKEKIKAAEIAAKKKENNSKKE